MSLALGRHARRARTRLFNFRSDKDGATAVEFGLICFPFFAIIFGIMGVCQIFFWIFTMENAVWSASRDMRTGAFQTNAVGSRYAGLAGDPLKTEFKKAICEKAVNYNDCFNHSSVLVQSNTTFAGIAAPNCKDGMNNLVSDTAAMAAFSAGAASSVVLITLCHGWSFGAKLSFLPMSNTLADGSLLIQASAAFRTEPYN